MNDIATKQNRQDLIELLKAQRVAYSQCMTFQFVDVVSLIIAIVFPLLTLKIPQYQNAINAFGVIWTVVYLAAEYYRKINTLTRNMRANAGIMLW
ncbi:MAG: S-4TM family putative pore-forming effector [Bacteroidota bacterium]